MASIALLLYLGFTLTEGEDRSVFMPGPVSDGHHAIAEACDACHGDPLGGGEVLQERCIACHGDERVKPHDSHPRSKFKDPRNADRLASINALECVTCHSEHRPDITLKNGLTQPLDVCFHCHQDIAEDRPSHAGMAFDTCASSGCHNFHNNRALYTDFLIKHLDKKPPRAKRRRLKQREFGEILDEIPDYPRERYPSKPLTLADADAPGSAAGDESVWRDWLTSRHAGAGVNCSACHQPLAEDGTPGAWQDHPGVAGCQACHGSEIERFGKGKHGMRLAVGLSPMTPEMARLPMHAEAAHSELTCNSCHPAHRYDTVSAAVEACLDCHTDEHSLAYEGSPHHQAWLREQSGEQRAGTGVSCASCHMPRIKFDVSEWSARIMVDHNNSASLSPNSKMIRPVCLKCHDLGLSIDALADRGLIDNNFRGQPSVHVESMDMARKDHERAMREIEGVE